MNVCGIAGNLGSRLPCHFGLQWVQQWFLSWRMRLLLREGSPYFRCCEVLMLLRWFSWSLHKIKVKTNGAVHWLSDNRGMSNLPESPELPRKSKLWHNQVFMGGVCKVLSVNKQAFHSERLGMIDLQNSGMFDLAQALVSVSVCFKPYLQGCVQTQHHTLIVLQSALQQKVGFECEGEVCQSALHCFEPRSCLAYQAGTLWLLFHIIHLLFRQHHATILFSLHRIMANLKQLVLGLCVLLEVFPCSCPEIHFW